MPIELQLVRDQVVERTMPLTQQVEVGRSFPYEAVVGAANRLVIAPQQQTTVPRRWFAVRPVDEARIQIENLHRAHAVLLQDSVGPIPPGDQRTLNTDAIICIHLYGDYVLRIGRSELLRQGVVVDEPYSGIRSLAPGAILAALNDSSSNVASGANVTLRPLADNRGTLDAPMVVALVRKTLRVVEAAAGSDGFLDAAVRAAVEIVGLDRAAILVAVDEDEDQQALGTDASADLRVKDASSSIASQSISPLDSILPSLSLRVPSGASTLANAEQERLRKREAMIVAGQKWGARSEYLASSTAAESAPPISRSVLQRVLQLQQTQIYDVGDDPQGLTIDRVASVVAAPILDRDKTVAAVLYGDRWNATGPSHSNISELEGVLLEVLASAVAGGIARQQEERSRANLSEFFSPRVASILVERPELLSGRDTEVSVLFCDVRGFSAISETHGAARTIEWINDVLTELSQCVVDQDGVLVDYVGDELLAMWGAPEAQPDHAARALATANNMMQAIDRLRERWGTTMGASLDVGIGINSGPARVGNVGSRLKFKYGVLGHTVNVGSRLQGACKQLGVRCIVSSAAVAASGLRTNTRRLAKLRVAGIREATEVYECVCQPTDQWRELRDEYEAALMDFEAGQPGETVHRLGRVLQSYPDDRPSAFLLARAAKMLTDPNSSHETIWELGSK